jgi:hypothetical protein
LSRTLTGDDGMAIRWDNVPAGAAAPRIPIQVWHVPRGLVKQRPVYVRLLGPWRSVWLHWSNEGRPRTLPCLAPPEKCPLCPKRSFRAGYAPALRFQKECGNTQEGWQPIVCCIPDRMMDALPGVDVAGLLVAFWREGTNDKSWIAWEVLEEKVKNEPPPAFDVESILTHWWGVQARMAALAKKQQDDAWKGDLNALVETSEQPFPGPAETAKAPPPVVAPPPPARPSPNGHAPRGPLPLMRDLEVKLHILPLPSTVEPAAAADLADVELEQPKAAKRPRRSRKGGA